MAPDPHRALKSRPWDQPPRSMLPGVAPTHLILARNNVMAAQLYGFRVWPTMFAFTLLMYVNPNLRPVDSDLCEHPVFVPSHVRREDRCSRLRLFEMGVVFPDGSRGSNLTNQSQRSWDPAAEPTPPLVTGAGGGGAGGHIEYTWRVWPLPPPGRVQFWCRWPHFDMPTCRADLDAEVLLSAAERATPLW